MDRDVSYDHNCCMRFFRKLCWPCILCCLAISGVCAACWRSLNVWFVNCKNRSKYSVLPSDVETGDSREREGDEYSRYKNEIAFLKAQLTELDNELQQEKNNNLQRIKQSELKLEQERNSFRERIRVVEKKYDERIQILEKSKCQLKEERESALNRLSSLMGEKLRDNNPTITNLNDPNRPMKLADQFGEIYENEWTDAFADLEETNSMDELEAINSLINILKEVLETCKEDIEQQILDHKQVMGLADGSADGSLSKYKETLKSEAADYIPRLVMKITSGQACRTIFTFKDSCLPYIQKCIEICYYAEVQTPPMYISFDAEPGTKFDKQCFKEYTKSGTYVDYLVWPALYLHKDGPLMAKGVVQPR